MISEGPQVQAQITFLNTEKLDETSRFYEAEIGLGLWRDQGCCRIYQVTDNAYLGFCERSCPKPSEGVILTLVVEDVDAFAAKLSDRGVILESSPTYSAEFDIYHFFISDPNGYKIEVQRFESSAPAPTVD